jgi:Family of unknown function (DUF6459)
MTVAPIDPPSDLLPALRVLAAPHYAPPCDDELDSPEPWPPRRRHLAIIPGQGELALEWILPGGVPARPDLPLVLLRGGRLEGDDGAEDLTDGEVEEEDDFGPLPTGRASLPAPGPWAGRLVQAVVEVIGGDRPLGQLVRWTHEDVYEQLRTLAARRPAAWPRRLRAQVRSVHVDEPTDGVAEVCAVVHDGVRARAYALRLEGADGRWSCTQFFVV